LAVTQPALAWCLLLFMFSLAGIPPLLAEMPAGSLQGLQLVVNDIKAARAELISRGMEVSEIIVLGENPSPQPDPLDNVGFFFFYDPDGNSWAVQQISSRS
ncbi:MAG: hypothetical protein AAF267_11890, partial [Deinococcota bacterium]